MCASHNAATNTSHTRVVRKPAVAPTPESQGGPGHNVHMPSDPAKDSRSPTPTATREGARAEQRS